MIIKIEDVKMVYGVKEVLNIPHLELEKGKAYGLVGHNGAGKTTLFKCITNIIATYSGHIYIKDTDVRDHNEVLLNVGIVLDGMSVYQDHTGWFNIQYFSGLRGLDYEEKALEMAKELQIEDVLQQPVSTYSYGMQKKLILLIELLHDPAILILDEPFRGLDAQTVTWFKNYLDALAQKGQTLLISSHVKNDLEALCDEVLVIEEGRLKESIDLEASRELEYRIIDTSDNERVVELLHLHGMAFKRNKEGLLKVDISQASWEAVYQTILQEKITINEMSRVKILEDKLN